VEHRSTRAAALAAPALLLTTGCLPG
jgi:hypothetical protein